MTTGDNSAPDADAVAERVRELSEQMITQAKQSGLSWLEAYEQVLENLLRLQRQAAQGTTVEWVADLAAAQADFVRETTKIYLGAARERLK